MLAAQQQQAGVAAAFAITQGQREAQKLTAEIRADLKEKLTAELEQTQAGIVERTRAGAGGTAQSTLESFGTYVEQLMSGESRGQVLENTVQFQAKNEADPKNREFAQQQLQRIEELKAQMVPLDETNKAGVVELKRMEDNSVAGRASQFVQEKDANKDGKIGLTELKDLLSHDMDQKNLDAIKGIPRADGQEFVTVAQMQKALIDSGGISELIQLQRENNEILKGQAPANKQAAPPQKQRPQVAPLPAATAP
jgi:hypothetical protein